MRCDRKVPSGRSRVSPKERPLQDYGAERRDGARSHNVPALGAQFKAGDNMNVDVHANFANIFTEGSSTNWVGFGIGFEWIMN